MKIRSTALVIIIFLLLTATLSACGGGSPVTLTLAAKDILPDAVKSASQTVQEAYRFAAANPEVLEQYPCYCGCSNIGHQSNRDCYIDSIAADGSITFDNHANGCTICVDITQDVMRLMREGKDAATIRNYIDATYSPFGPGTDTPPVNDTIDTCNETASACGKEDNAAPALNLNGAPESAVPAPRN